MLRNAAFIGFKGNLITLLHSYYKEMRPLHSRCVTNYENLECADVKCLDQNSTHQLQNKRATDTQGKELMEKFGQDTPEVLGTLPPTRQEVQQSHSRFWAGFRMLVGQFEVLLQTLVLQV